MQCNHLQFKLKSQFSAQFLPHGRQLLDGMIQIGTTRWDPGMEYSIYVQIFILCTQQEETHCLFQKHLLVLYKPIRGSRVVWLSKCSQSQRLMPIIALLTCKKYKTHNRCKDVAQMEECDVQTESPTQKGKNLLRSQVLLFFNLGFSRWDVWN